MLGKTLETVFIKTWVIVKLNLLFWLFSAAGLIVAGIGPALKTVNDLFATHGFEYKEITIKEGWQRFKANFVRGNGLFYSACLSIGFFMYNLFLSVQIQGIIFLMIDFLLVFGIIYLVVVFQYALLLDSYYDINLGNLLKLSFISTLSSFMNLLKIAIGTTVIIYVTWQYKGLILFGTVSLMQLWTFYATKNWRETLDERLGFYA